MNIGGATVNTYTTLVGDVGAAIDCVVTASNAEGAGAPVDSNNITVTAAPTAPVISSFVQSHPYTAVTGPWLEAASLANMGDGKFEPFAANGPTGSTTTVTAVLAARAFVSNIILGPTTNSGGWGAQYLNGVKLQVSDGGSVWETIRTLSEYVNASSPTVGTMKTEAINRDCTHIRLLYDGGGSAYIAVSEFKIAP